MWDLLLIPNLFLGLNHFVKLKNVRCIKLSLKKQFIMASGFIILKDRRCFGRRWTGYDEILKIAIKELYLIENGKDLAKWLETQIPDLDNESGECG